MDFGLSEDQIALKKSAREFVEAEAPIALARKMLTDKKGFEQSLWDHMAELGWMGVAIPEADGGLGLGLLELSLILEEMARTVTPSPYFSTVALAAPVAAALGGAAATDLIRRIAAGQARATVAIAEADGSFTPAGIKARAVPAEGGWKLSGAKLFVPDAHAADEIIVLARTGKRSAKDPAAGISAFAVPTAALKSKPKQHASLDRTRRMCEVRVGGVVVGADRLVGPEGAAWPLVERALDRTAAAIAAEAAGVSGVVVERTVGYARERQQFGRAIGSFQAVSHKCADMLMASESARSHAYFASWAIDEARPEAALAAATAKSGAGVAATKVCKLGIQVHGGIGFTWEHDMHLYFRRAKLLELFLGNTQQWRERIASLIE